MNKYLHIVLIVLFIAIPIFSSPDLDGSFKILTVAPFQRTLLQHTLLLAFFYANFYLFLPKFYTPKKYWILGLIFVVGFFLIANIPSWIFSDFHIAEHRYLEHPHQGHGPDLDDFISRKYIKVFIPFLFTILFSMYLYVNELHKKREAEISKAQLLNLKYQLQPHFLFNTLNSIYALSLSQSEETPDVILKLSNIMRYVVGESDKESVPLERELTHIQDYVSLQMMRVSDMVNCEVDFKGNAKHLQIAPMLLINFVENAFKYGYSPEEKAVIKINSEIIDNKLIFTTFNTKNHIKSHSTQKGISNTQKRLEQLYPNQYQLNITDNPEDYTVQLELNL